MNINLPIPFSVLLIAFAIMYLVNSDLLINVLKSWSWYGQFTRDLLNAVGVCCLLIVLFTTYLLIKF